jgi:hypothetical protein
MPTIDLRADLNADDDEGRGWSLMRDAVEPSVIVSGAMLVAGTERFWSVVRVEQVDDDGQVHLVAVPPDDPASLPCSPGRPDTWPAMYQRCTTPSGSSG